MQVTALAGGVGGAKLAHGLSMILPPEDLGVIVNTGDDFNYLGYSISPDLDTVMYNLAGINNPTTGYGLQGDTYHVVTGLERYGHEIWFRLGDTDIATQIERTNLLLSGKKLSEIINYLAFRLGVRQRIFPMCDEPVRTMIVTDKDITLPFQEYFVKHHFQPVVKKILFEGSEVSRLPIPAQAYLENSDLVILCPSNPYLSIDPILAVPGVIELLKEKTVFSVSPIIGGKTIKGPAAKIMTELGVEVSNVSIAKHYREFLTGIVIDTRDVREKDQIQRCGIIPYSTDVFMADVKAQERLARKVLEFSVDLLKDKVQ